MRHALPKKTAWIASAVLAVAAGAAAWAAVAPLEPSLSLHLTPMAITADTQVWMLRVEPRGGETIGEIALVRDPEKVGLLQRDVFTQVQPDNAALFTLRASRAELVDPVVLIRMTTGGRTREFEIALPIERPAAGTVR